MQASPEQVAFLYAIESIKALKARYFRAMDSKDWQLLADTMTDDVTLVHPVIGVQKGVTDVVAAIRARIEPMRLTVHHGSMPEILIEEDGGATGIWALHSCIQRSEQGADATLVHGYGRYHDRYRLQNGQWRIFETKLEHFYKR